MKGWNYRLIKQEHDHETVYRIHEVYYDNSDEPTAWSEDHIAPFGIDVYDIQCDLIHMIQALGKPVFEIIDDNLVEVKE